jgi:hypothetical protein
MMAIAGSALHPVTVIAASTTITAWVLIFSTPAQAIPLISEIAIIHRSMANGQSYKTIAMNRRCQDEKYIAHYDRLVFVFYSLPRL